MKKKLLAVSSLVFACMLAFGACGGKTASGGGNTDNGGSSESSSGKKEGLQAELLDLGADFNDEYYPVTEKLEERQGRIDVSILFDGTLPGWKAVAAEYQRLHRDQVVVKLDETQVATSYATNLNYQLSGGNTEWDIVQGNVAQTGYTQRYCLNMYPSIGQKNYYAGDKYWGQVLEEDAYISDKTGSSVQTYLMNSEGLQTAWFINTVALQAAGTKGYKNGDGEVGMPKTWDELMDLCAKMELAGYANPMGISLDTDSISASQFTWLLRVYGDYYYRNEYNQISKTDGYEVNLRAENPESAKDYNYSNAKLFNIVLGEGMTGEYVGANSDKYLDFVSQFGKMKDYLREDAAGTPFATMRTDFQFQTKGKESPQIMLDYVGAGLGFMSSQNEKFQMDFFDYPIMESEFVEKNTLLRDVGGNGGYLSIVNHDNDQNALTLDFIKFFMSPYGQTVYYKGLNEAKAAPKGLTLVKTDYVIVPQEWKDFFATDKISFTGLSDSNPFIGYFLRGLDGLGNSSAALQSLWSGYLKGNTSLDEFGGQFQDALMADWPDFCKSKQWETDCYTKPEDYDY